MRQCVAMTVVAGTCPCRSWTVGLRSDVDEGLVVVVLAYFASRPSGLELSYIWSRESGRHGGWSRRSLSRPPVDWRDRYVPTGADISQSHRRRRRPGAISPSVRPSVVRWIVEWRNERLSRLCPRDRFVSSSNVSSCADNRRQCAPASRWLMVSSSSWYLSSSPS